MLTLLEFLLNSLDILSGLFPLAGLKLKRLPALCEPWKPISSCSPAVLCLALWNCRCIYNLVSAADSRGSCWSFLCCFTPSSLVLHLEKSPHLPPQLSKPLWSALVSPHCAAIQKVLLAERVIVELAPFVLFFQES